MKQHEMEMMDASVRGALNKDAHSVGIQIFSASLITFGSKLTSEYFELLIREHLEKNSSNRN